MVLETSNLLLQRQNTYWWGTGSKELLGCGPLYRKKDSMRIFLSIFWSCLAYACCKFPLLPTPKSDLCETNSWSNGLEVVFIQDPVYKSLDYSQLLRGRRKKLLTSKPHCFMRSHTPGPYIYSRNLALFCLFRLRLSGSCPGKPRSNISALHFQV